MAKINNKTSAKKPSKKIKVKVILETEVSLDIFEWNGVKATNANEALEYLLNDAETNLGCDAFGACWEYNFFITDKNGDDKFTWEIEMTD